MKVIDLLNKIANGEEVPKEIKYNACLFAFERQSQDYYCEEYGNLFEYLINEHRTGEFLNDEVEIIEEDKKIEKMSDFYEEQINENGSMSEMFNKHELKIIDKINEIMDKFLAMCLIIIQISNLFEFYKIRKEIKELKKEK